MPDEQTALASASAQTRPQSSSYMTAETSRDRRRSEARRGDATRRETKWTERRFAVSTNNGGGGGDGERTRQSRWEKSVARPTAAAAGINLRAASAPHSSGPGSRSGKQATTKAGRLAGGGEKPIAIRADCVAEIVCSASFVGRQLGSMAPLETRISSARLFLLDLFCGHLLSARVHLCA